MSKHLDETFCRICGFDDEEVRYTNGRSPSFDICICCGAEAGFHDYTLENIRTYRSKWIESGCPWELEEFKPKNWSLEEQMKNIPPEYL